MELISTDQKLKCFHCGDECSSSATGYDQKHFCCQGCKSVYEILVSGDLTNYYKLESTPGTRGQTVDQHKFACLDNTEVVLRLLDFSSENLAKVRFSVPAIHCSSCVWLLENLCRLTQGVLSSRVNLGERQLAVDFRPGVLSLRALVELLASIGYEPLIMHEQRRVDVDRSVNRNLVLKIAVAGFCFGNIMLLSFPEYLGLDHGTDQMLASWFSRIIMILSLPVLFYCASGYFRSALDGLKQKYLTIDVPIVLGIIALAVRSYYEIIFTQGTGYLDSLAGLLFLLLIGQWFQHKTYSNLSFNRDFRAYFPLAVTRVDNGYEKVVLVEKLCPGDIIAVRNGELVPADSILLEQTVSIDYSFVSGESQPVTRGNGEHIFAGGRHVGPRACYKVIKPVSQSYLTQLWNHQAFKKSKDDPRQLLINMISKYFTLVVLLLATFSAAYWLTADPGKSLFVFTSVLIVACPCALAMATPFALGHTLRVMGNNRLYLKNAQVVNTMGRIDTIVFDKTGTLTRPEGKLAFSSHLSQHQVRMLGALTGQSNHPVSRAISLHLQENFNLEKTALAVSEYQEFPGAGISANIDGHLVKLGNREFVNGRDDTRPTGTYLSIDHEVIGSFYYQAGLREGLPHLFDQLSKRFALSILSGDNDHQRAMLARLPGLDSQQFSQTPLDKLQLIEKMQLQGKQVMMLGDGLNDAGALQHSHVGLAVTENPQYFTPASDGILHVSGMEKLYSFMRLARWTKQVIIAGIGLSLIYNVAGLSFAVSGNLTPLTAAVLMPLSSISVVVFTTMAVKLRAFKLGLN